MTRFWDDGPPSDQLDILMVEVSPAKDALPLRCPLCDAHDLHIFFYRHGDHAFGGGWVWCSHCRRFSHARARVPDWWENATFIEVAQLFAIPEELDRRAALVDEHWNALVERSATDR